MKTTYDTKRGREFWFNVSDLPVAEDILGAELRIFKKERFLQRYPKYTVRLSQIVKSKNGAVLEHISSVNTTEDYLGWIEFNVTACLSNWATFPGSNHGIYLSVHVQDNPDKELKPDDMGLVTAKDEEETKPFMVAFMKVVNRVNARSKRNINKSRIRKSDLASIIRGAYRNAEPIDTWKTCRVHNLYISFRDLQWQDWIIAPEGYAAYYCGGECSFPLHSHMNATNHAIVQTLVHLMNPLRYPKPCCAPTKLKPISVLYYLDDHNVILKKYKNMMVKSCGCH
ncbi:hypothetical protein NQ314_008583 [Rhamnusium bicolor]|uniref:TGF-beta family profile domain-containing protein n=1 Tax=Rhamnusium bicolor TaxID=1586634 RepID=A0AAV8YAM5_9CUCU|nr:hypothetical protein NQ314_008583 [Rhamnusium bicolor]